MVFALTNGKIFTENRFVSDHCVLYENGHILDIIPDTQIPKKANIFDLDGALLAPGFVDIQVNGGGGVLFNDAPTLDTIAAIGKAHRQYGTTGFLPTLISDDLDVIQKAIQAVDTAILQGVPGVLGIHIEGPFLSTDRKGIHDPSKFKFLEPKHIALLTSLQHGKTLVTLAPENTPSELIKELVQAGVIVSAGHTNATYQETKSGLDSGISGFTHLFNAMSPFTSREPGVVGAALEDQNSWCGLIIDGEHVSPTSLKIALKCKPIEKFIIVTDAMPSVGSDKDYFYLQGKKVITRGQACVTKDGTLAGSNLDMAHALRNAVHLLDIPLADALNMATKNPAQHVGLGKVVGSIVPGYVANFVTLSSDFEVIHTWINGQISTAEYVRKTVSA